MADKKLSEETLVTSFDGTERLDISKSLGGGLWASGASLLSDLSGYFGAGGGGKTVLTDNITLYARAGGLDDDSRSGLVDDDANAFATIGYAYDRAMNRYDAGGQWNININWDGTDITSVTPVNCFTPIPTSNPYVLIFLNGANLTATASAISVFSTSPGFVYIFDAGVITASGGSAVYVEGVSLEMSAAEMAGSIVGSADQGHFFAIGPTTKLSITGAMTISGGGSSYAIAKDGASIDHSASADFNHNAVAFTHGVLRARSGGRFRGAVFTNVENVTGDKFSASQQSTISITNFFGTPYSLSNIPGDTFGTVAAGSVVVGLPTDMIVGEEGFRATTTWNDGAHQFTAPLVVDITDTASLPGSQAFDVKVNTTSVFRVEKDGLVRAPGGIVAGGTFNADYVQTNFGIGLGGDPWSGVFYGNGTSLYSTADGVVLLSNGVADSFDRLVFGVDSSGGSPAATAAFPALKRSGTTLQARLADDSGDAHLSAATVTHVGVAFASLPGSPVTGMTACVTDSNTATWGATIAGSGANTVLAWYNGTNWTVIGA